MTMPQSRARSASRLTDMLDGCHLVKEQGKNEEGGGVRTIFKEERTDERVRASVWQEEKWKA